MNRLRIAALALLLANLPAHAETAVPEGEFASLQAAMQNHIDESLVDGAFLRVDEATGKIQSLFPSKAHPTIMTIGKLYYMCSNFRDDAGKEVMVNFIIAKDQNRYVVIHTSYGENEALEHRLEKNAKFSSK